MHAFAAGYLGDFGICRLSTSRSQAVCRVQVQGKVEGTDLALRHAHFLKYSNVTWSAVCINCF